MTRYFVHLERTNAPANALQRAAAEHLGRLDGLIIGDGGGVADFLIGLQNTIEGLNDEHPRCTPLDFYKHNISTGLSVSLGVHFVVGFYLYEIKETAAPASEISDPESEIATGARYSLTLRCIRCRATWSVNDDCIVPGQMPKCGHCKTNDRTQIFDVREPRGSQPEFPLRRAA